MTHLNIIRGLLGVDHVTDDIAARVSAALDEILPGGILSDPCATIMSDDDDTIVRIVRPEDAPQIEAMAWLAGDHTTPLTHPERDGLHVVAEQDGEILGEAFGYGEMTGTVSTSIAFTLDNIIVDAGRRREGIALAMGQAMIDFVDRLRQAVGTVRFGHTAGRITVDGDTRPDSPAEGLVAELKDDADAKSDMPMAEDDPFLKYIVADAEADLWEHLFEDADGTPRERNCRFVYDVEDGVMIHVQIFQDNAWNTASEAERADVEDSLKTGNPEAIDVPLLLGLRVTDDLPDWIMDTPAPGM